MSKLKEYCIKITDGEHGSIKDDPDGAYFFLNNNNITDDGIVIHSSDRKMSKQDYERIHSRTQLSNGDVVIASCGTIGKTQVITDEVINYDFSRSVGIIKCNNEKLLPEFLHYYFKNPTTQQRVLNASEGAVQKHFYIGAMSDFEVNFPDINVQKDIVDFLIKIDAKIRNNNAICADLEGMAKLLYDYWFVQFDFPDENGNPYKSSGGKMVWSEELKREIPEGWEVAPLERCIDTIIDHRGLTPKKMGGEWATQGQGVMALSAKIVKNNRLNNLDDANWVTEEMYHAWMSDELRDGDILMTSEAPLGEFYYLKGYSKYCLSQRLYAIRADRRNALPSYLFLYLSEGIGYKLIMGKQSGSTVFGIRQDELKKVITLLPGLDIQEQFCNIIDGIYEKIRIFERENQQLASLRDFLLPMLMNGQVKVGTGLSDPEKVVRYDFSGAGQGMIVAEETKYGTKKD